MVMQFHGDACKVTIYIYPLHLHTSFSFSACHLIACLPGVDPGGSNYPPFQNHIGQA